jgi:hypothetical protein
MAENTENTTENTQTRPKIDVHDTMALIQRGKELYDEIHATNGLSIDYYAKRIIDYTWDDFGALTQYEKANGLAHHYSAMMAVNLVKGTVKNRELKFLEFGDVCVGDTYERLQEYFDELYMRFLEKIKTWDITTGVYFDQYVKMEMRTTAERVGNFDIYGTGNAKRIQERKDIPVAQAIGYNEKYNAQSRSVRHHYNPKGYLISPESVETDDITTRSVEEQYIMRHEEKNDPDNKVLADKRINIFVQNIITKVEDAELLTDEEKKYMGKTIQIMQYEADRPAYSQGARDAIHYAWQLAARDIDRENKAIDMGIELNSNTAVTCYNMYKNGYDKPTIARTLGLNEKLVRSYITNTTRYKTFMESHPWKGEKKEQIWYLGITGTISAATTNALIHAGIYTVDDLKKYDKETLIELSDRRLTRTKNAPLKEVLQLAEKHGFTIPDGQTKINLRQLDDRIKRLSKQQQRDELKNQGINTLGKRRGKSEMDQFPKGQEDMDDDKDEIDIDLD